MASKFQKAIAEIRGQVALQGAETVARLKQVETELHWKIGQALTEVHRRLSEGFSGFEEAVSVHTFKSQENFEILLVGEERERPDAA